MVRGLVVACVALAALCVLQWRTLGRLRGDLATADARALQVSVVDRREELVRAMTWLDAYLRSDADLQRPRGLCPEGQPDLEAVGKWILEVYVRERGGGASETESRRRVIEAIRAERQSSR